MAYDLSFAEMTKPSEGAGPVQGTAYVRAGDPQTPGDIVEQMEQRRSEGGFPQRPEEGFYSKLRGMVTGKGRETRATQELPALADAGISNFFGDGSLPNAMAFLSSYDPAEQVRILQQRYPDLTVSSDEAGNVLLNYNNRQVLLNRPGFSRTDAMRMGGTMAAFTPAAKTVRAGAGILNNAARVGGASLATQSGLEGLQATQGGEFSSGEVALAGASGAGAQALFQSLTPLARMLTQRMGRPRIDDGVREQFKRYAVELGFDPDDVTDGVIESVFRRTSGGTPEERIGQALEKDFQIPLTRGERSLSQPDLREEDLMRQGLRGGGAESRMTRFDQDRGRLVEEAADRLTSRVSMGSDPQQAASMVRGGVRAAERSADEAVNAMYDIGTRAELSPDGFRGMLSEIRNTLRRDTGIDVTLPETKKLLDGMGSALKTFRDAPKAGGRLKPIHLDRLEQYRRRINTAIGAADNPSDKRQVTQIKRMWDDYLDRAVEQKLFSGDPQDLADLKEARSAFRDYASKFRQNPVRGKSGRVVDQDPAGRFIERMIDANPTDEEIMNAVFGAADINSQTGVAMWNRFSDILAETDPEAMMALKGAALRRLIKTTNFNGQPVISGSKTITAIQKAMEKSGTLMRTIFPEDELQEIRRFASAVKRTQPDIAKSRQNPSGSGVTAMRAFRDMASRLSLDPSIIMITETGSGIASGMRGGGAAARAIRPFSSLAAGSRTGVVATEAGMAEARNPVLDYVRRSRANNP